MDGSNIRKSYVPTSLLGFANAYVPTEVHIRNGKIIRLKPMFFDGFSYTIKARGKTFTKPGKTLQAPFELAFKLRVYSPNRVKYPLKRVDFDPNGKRNTQNRGKSGYVRISWDGTKR